MEWDTTMPKIVTHIFCGHAPMRNIAATFATVLFFSITVFSLGPLRGSLDVDRDGVPDVPVMVMLISNNQNWQTKQNGASATTNLAKESSLGQKRRPPAKRVIGRIGTPLRC